MRPVAVVVDNGEPLLEKCIRSLRDQTLEPKIIIAPGPRTDLELAESLADLVLEPETGIGRGRVKAILKADSDYVISCDSDTIYGPGYVERAVNDLRFLPVVKAGTIVPYEPSPLALLEASFASVIPYEFSLALRRQWFIANRIHLADYRNPRADIAAVIIRKTIVPADPLMSCRTRMPTHWMKKVSRYLPSLIAALAAAGLVLAPVALSELEQKFSWRNLG